MARVLRIRKWTEVFADQRAAEFATSIALARGARQSISARSRSLSAQPRAEKRELQRWHRDAHDRVFRQQPARFDVAEVRGFAICRADKVWHWADAKIVGCDQVEVTSPKVPAPIAVPYAWADNPVCNLHSADGLPVTPFRTDNFEMITRPKSTPAAGQ
jgi:hypothetical protein